VSAGHLAAAGLQSVVRIGIFPGMREEVPIPDVTTADGPDPERVETWVFDLDNTLYPASSDLFAQVNARINAFIASALAIDEAAALELQSRYFADYRSSLRGLMLHHDVEPRRFLDYVHDIDLSPIGPDPELRAAIEALSGRKVIFTNGSTRHARQILRQRGLEGLFEDIFDIEAAAYLPKPYPETYHQLIARNAIVPERSVLLEDMAINLEPAAELGMTTVWVRDPKRHDATLERPDYVHHEVTDLTGWLGSLLA
jgi:putative hydrolase of the HAD superfamily